MNNELAELVGAFIGDGFIGKYDGHYHVEFAGNPRLDDDYFRYLFEIIKAHFKVNPRLKVHERALRLIITYKELYEFFKNLGFNDGVKNGTVFIPENLYRSKLVKFVIVGMFDTDGYLYIDRRSVYKEPYARIGYTTKS
ncbi:MAG: hypothetical protein HYT71_02070 [Candidatus Aenigmarchaeota archaeon]|nr:hypothetical protein [Candidatus Aenigmarchaeota archaeon]